VMVSVVCLLAAGFGIEDVRIWHRGCSRFLSVLVAGFFGVQSPVREMVSLDERRACAVETVIESESGS